MSKPSAEFTSANYADMQSPYPTSFGSRVAGIQVFISLVSLYFAASFHPLSCSLDHIQNNRHYICLGPLSCLCEVVFYLQEVLNKGLQKAVLCRLTQQQTRGFSVNSRIRLVILVILVEQYAKLWSYSGIPVSLGIATVLFASFLLFEIGLLGVMLAGEDTKTNPAKHVILTTCFETNMQCGPPKKLRLKIQIVEDLLLLISALVVLTNIRYCAFEQEATNSSSPILRHLPPEDGAVDTTVNGTAINFSKDSRSQGVVCTTTAYELVWLYLAFIMRTGDTFLKYPAKCQGDILANIGDFYPYLFGGHLVVDVNLLWRLPLAVLYTVFCTIPLLILTSVLVLCCSYLTIATAASFVCLPLYCAAFVTIRVMERVRSKEVLRVRMSVFGTIFTAAMYYLWVWDGNKTRRAEWSKYLP